MAGSVYQTHSTRREICGEYSNKPGEDIREVNIQAEEFYKDAVDLGTHAAYTLKDNHRSQMTGLENIAESALKYSDIFDYIKRQTARYSYWQQGPEHEKSGEAFGDAF